MAVLSFRRGAGQRFDAADIDAVERLLAPLSGALPLVSRATRKLPAHALQSARAGAGWLLVRGSVRKRLAVVALLAFVGWALFATRVERITVPAAVVAEREHIVAVSEAGTIASVLVCNGDRVHAGDVLLRMETALLVLQRTEIGADIQRAELLMAEGIVNGEPATAAIAQGELRSLRAELARVDERIDACIVRAPCDGIVVGADLGDLDGRVVATGESLLAIVESDALRIELRVPEGRVTDLAAGQSVQFASHARPESPQRTALGRVAPASVQRNGKTVFLGEADLADIPDWLRPGMEGVAMIEADEHPNWWIATRRLLDGARLRFWID